MKTVLLSYFPFPFSGIASWTTMMNHLLSEENEIDYIISPITQIKTNTSKQVFINSITFFDRVKNKYDNRSRFNPYIRELTKILLKEDKIIIQIIDNLGLLKAVIHFIKKKNLKEKVYIQYHYHSFSTFTQDESIINSIDELVLLTSLSYNEHKRVSSVLPFEVSINPNGVDGAIFKKMNKEQRNLERKKINIEPKKIVFVWCSQDRKKKGLELVLRLWQRIYPKYSNQIELLIIGTNKKINKEGVKVVGRVENNKLSKYYQLSDIYIYPTLCLEGFGLTLLEALKSGCYCIASSLGGVPEVLNFGKYGKLIESPHLIENWVIAVEEAIEQCKTNKNNFSKNLPLAFYEMKDWQNRFNQIIREAKVKFENRLY